MGWQVRRCLAMRTRSARGHVRPGSLTSALCPTSQNEDCQHRARDQFAVMPCGGTPRVELTGRAQHLAHVHVLGLSIHQFSQRFRHRLVAPTEVEPHGVFRWRRRDDHVRVTGGAGDLFELISQTAADTGRTRRCAYVEECKLRNLRSSMASATTHSLPVLVSSEQGPRRAARQLGATSAAEQAGPASQDPCGVSLVGRHHRRECRFVPTSRRQLVPAARRSAARRCSGSRICRLLPRPAMFRRLQS